MNMKGSVMQNINIQSIIAINAPSTIFKLNLFHLGLYTILSNYSAVGICSVLNNMSDIITLYVPQCIQQVFSLKLFGLIFQQSYTSLDINTGSLDECAIRVHMVVKDDQADQYAQHEKMSFLFSKLNGTVKHNKTHIV